VFLGMCKPSSERTHEDAREAFAAMELGTPRQLQKKTDMKNNTVQGPMELLDAIEERANATDLPRVVKALRLSLAHLYVRVSQPTDVAALTGLGARTGYLPMCRYGWNRSDGERFSILRGHGGSKGLCKICQRRERAGLPGVRKSQNPRKDFEAP
jgi:hypothetical protein